MEMADYFGQDMSAIQNSFMKNRQFSFDNFIFHMEEDGGGDLSPHDFNRMFNQVVSDGMLVSANEEPGYEYDTKEGLISVSLGGLTELVIPSEPIHAITSHKLLMLIKELSSRLAKNVCLDAPTFEPDFGYPEPKSIDWCSTNTGSDWDLDVDAYFKEREEFDIFIESEMEYVDRVNRELEEESEIQNHMNAEDGGTYDEKGNSAHYQQHFMEFIRAQERSYGTIVAFLVCQSNIDKYSQRAGMKDGVPAEKDLTKRDWYFKAAKHFADKIMAMRDKQQYVVSGRNHYVELSEEVLDLLRAEPTLEVLSDKYVTLSESIEK